MQIYHGFYLGWLASVGRRSLYCIRNNFSVHSITEWILIELRPFLVVIIDPQKKVLALKHPPAINFRCLEIFSELSFAAHPWGGQRIAVTAKILFASLIRKLVMWSIEFFSHSKCLIDFLMITPRSPLALPIEFKL